MDRWSHLTYWSLVVLLLGVVYATDFGIRLGARSLDLWQTGHTPHPDIVILAIDNQSIEKIGRWPWSREMHAQILDRLASAKPTAIALDVTFTETESAEADKRLRQSLDASSLPVILVGQAVYQAGQTEPDRFLLPIPILRESDNVSVGHINVNLDPDGMARNIPAPLSINDKTYQPLGALVASRLGASLPDQPAQIDFAGSAGSFPTYPIAALLDGSLDLHTFADRIVLIGATASDLRDTVLAPVDGSVIAGVEWNANVVDNLLLGRFRTHFPTSTPFWIGVGLALLGWLAFQRLSTRLVWWGLATAAIILPLVSYLLWRVGWALPYGQNLVLVVGLASYHGVFRWLESEADKRRLRAAFRPYFAPQVLEAILRDPTSVKLGGERREVTVFFSDIRNFTTISESLPPEQMTRLLSEYFEAMSDEIFATEGVLSEFVGDGIVAFWGAPIEQSDHADRAVTTALKMFARLAELRPKWEAAGLPVIDIGIGINTGEAIVGNTGSSKRFDYAAIGDTTNAASRIESLNKEYKTHILISESTKRQLTISVKTRTIGNVKVKGKARPLYIHEVLLPAGDDNGHPSS